MSRSFENKVDLLLNRPPTNLVRYPETQRVGSGSKPLERDRLVNQKPIPHILVLLIELCKWKDLLPAVLQRNHHLARRFERRPIDLKLYTLK